jgi:hypothetical protein
LNSGPCTCQAGTVPPEPHFQLFVCFYYFSYRVSLLCLGWPSSQSFYLYFLHSWMPGIYHCTQIFIGWDEISTTFCPGWPQIMILLISASQVGRITGMSHHAHFHLGFIWAK